ncbi:hypothetical protein GQX73_g2590 [Xylaria multiplex]|uniref:Smr domain-containing protein n=1 Tax=Xylaria multiplex TaxID=323545 RepID=A0A7C8IWU7_9PEZI|nr:hypothetical protein GQX73_g2590 [Xylaria multiplex]
MHFLRRLFRSGLRHPPSVARYGKIASAGTKTAGIAMVAYACTVAAQPVADKVPDKHSKDHHVKNSRGETVKFQNPHPSHVFPAFSVLIPGIMYAKPLSYPLHVHKKYNSSRHAKAEVSRQACARVGHACYYVEYPSGLRVLFDPVFEDCCAPVNFLGFKRYTERPCDIADIPYVDAVVISHSHYDHLSYPSVLEIQKHHPNAHFFVGLGLEKWFKTSGIDKVTEMDWWDEAEVTFTPKPTKEADTQLEPIKARISCLPSQHSSGRTGLDRDRTLWASWGIRSAEKTVWFGGDTGYRTVPKVAEGIDDWGPEFQKLPVCPQFRQIGEHLGSVDLGLIPIGAYEPRHIFSHMHANPMDSVEIFRDTNCKRAMGIHWGTWILTPEHPLEPPRLLKEALKRRGLPETGVFDVLISVRLGGLVLMLLLTNLVLGVGLLAGSEFRHLSGRMDELCSVLDQATILSISSDYDLGKPEEFAAAREVLLAISKDVAAEEATGFNPSGFGGDDFAGLSLPDESTGSEGMPRPDGDLKSNDGLTTTTESSSSHSNSRGALSSSSSQASARGTPGVIHVSILDGLTNEDKVRQLAAMFVSLKHIDVKLALQKAKGNADLAIDELLNLQLLEQTGERPKGVDGFYVSDDDIHTLNKKERRKKKKASKLAALRSVDAPLTTEIPPQGTDADNGNIGFISDNLTLPLDEAADLYQRHKRSLGAAIIAALDAYLALSLSFNDPNKLPQVDEQQKRVPWIPNRYFGPILDMTATTQAATNIIDVLANYFEKPAYVRYDVSYSVVAGVDSTPKSPVENNSMSLWQDIRPSHNKPRPVQQLHKLPTTLEAASSRKAIAAASAKHSYASASSAYKKGKSDPYMRQAAGFFADRARSEAASQRQLTSIEAGLLVDKQSTEDTIDLHGVSVQDGVDIAVDRVWNWWNSLGENKVRKAREAGLKVVTGLGRHSSDGKSRLRVNVFKALVADGWKVQVLTGAYLVTGRI